RAPDGRLERTRSVPSARDRSVVREAGAIRAASPTTPSDRPDGGARAATRREAVLKLEGEGTAWGAGPTESARRTPETRGSRETRRAIEAVWRIESAKLIARLARMVGDVGLAEDMAQDALVVALERWPEAGVPENPGAW